MKLLFKFAVMILLINAVGVVFIRFIYDCSWRESIDIADEFVNDLLG